MSWINLGGLVLLAAAMLGGCAGQIEAAGENEYGIRATELPEVPACDARAHDAHGVLTVRPIIDANGLVLVYSDGLPHCIDTLEGAARSLSGSVLLDGAPHVPRLGYSDSDPMPGQDPDKNSSDPMPGKEDSDPMPGRPQ